MSERTCNHAGEMHDDWGCVECFLDNGASVLRNELAALRSALADAQAQADAMRKALEKVRPKTYGDTARGRGIGGQTITSECRCGYGERVEDVVAAALSATAPTGVLDVIEAAVAETAAEDEWNSLHTVELGNDPDEIAEWQHEIGRAQEKLTATAESRRAAVAELRRKECGT